MNPDVQVLVVGAGPTGLTMANELARLGVRCRLIDKAPQPSPFSKALGVQARTLEYFERIGIADAAVAGGRRLHGINVFSGGRRIVHLNFDQIASRYNFVLVLPQSETERLLGEHLGPLGLAAERGVELVSLRQEPDGVEAVLRRPGTEERLRVPWLIGCDGAHSAARHLLGIPFEGKAFEEAFSLADLRLESDAPDDEITVYLSHGNIVGLFPMPGAQRCRIVIEHPVQQSADSEPTLAEFQEALEACGLRGARLSDPVWTARFRISQRRVARYRQGRVFLAGDAAHIHSPVGGQGMNTGIQDACNLAWKLALVEAGRGRPDLLDSYQQERQTLGKKLLRATEAMTRLILWRHPVAVAVRDRVASLLTSLDSVQDMIRGAVSELAVNYRNSPIVHDHTEQSAAGRVAGWFHAGAGPRAGDRALDGPAERLGDGGPVRLFELMPGTRHTLLWFAGRRTGPDDARRRREALGAVADEYGDLIDPYVVVLAPAESPSESEHAPVLLDAGGALHRAYGADGEVLFLIRPDGYIGFRCQPAAAGPLESYLGSVFLPAACVRV
jgi:2-polyprenyl-6-methoxyphenol hydroxylase-like FAD-dependent oxidoreductase